jgi:hypothetical protein
MSRPSTRGESASRGRTDEAIRRAGSPPFPGIACSPLQRDFALIPRLARGADVRAPWRPAPCYARNKARHPRVGPSRQSSLRPAPRRRISGLSARFRPLEVNVALKNFKFLLGLLILSAPTVAQAKCFSTVHEIQANHVKTRWQETTENDGKPLMISITDGSHGLVYSARKAGALWLTGNVSVCQSGGATEITLKNTRATSNVPMMARLALPSRQSGRIVNNRIKLGGAGWSGTFIGR